MQPRWPPFLRQARARGLLPRRVPGGLLVGGGQTRGPGGRLRGQGRVGEVLLPAPGQAGQQVRVLARGRVLSQVDGEDLALGPGRPAEAVQEEQQEGQEQHDGGGQQDAQEGLHVIFGGADLLGALEWECGQLGDGDRRALPAFHLSFFWSWLTHSRNHSFVPSLMPMNLSLHGIKRSDKIKYGFNMSKIHMDDTLQYSP